MVEVNEVDGVVAVVDLSDHSHQSLHGINAVVIEDRCVLKKWARCAE